MTASQTIFSALPVRGKNNIFSIRNFPVFLVDKSREDIDNGKWEGSMWRLTRIVVVTVAVVIIAWVIKEFVGSDGKKAEDLIQKIRLSGI